MSADDGEADYEPEAVEGWDGGAGSISDFEVHCVADEAACVVDFSVCARLMLWGARLIRLCIGG